MDPLCALARREWEKGPSTAAGFLPSVEATEGLGNKDSHCGPPLRLEAEGRQNCYEKDGEGWSGKSVLQRKLVGL